MIGKLPIIALTFFSFALQSQSFTVAYGFADVTPNTGVVDPSKTPSIEGLVFGSFKAIGTPSNPSASGRFSYTDWPIGSTQGVDTYSTFTGNLSATNYYQVSIYVVPGYSLSLNDVYFSVRRSSTGIRMYCVRSNRDNFNTNVSVTTGTNSKLSVVPNNIFFWNYDSVSTSSDQKGSKLLLDTNFKNITDSLVLRFYAWNSETNAGTFSLDDVYFIGEVSDTLHRTSLNENQFEEKIQIRPNPAQRSRVFVTLYKQVYSFDVLNIMGKTILHVDVLPGQNCINLDLSAYESGIYFIETKTNERRRRNKFILE